MRCDPVARWRRAGLAARLVLLLFLALAVGGMLFVFVDPNMTKAKDSIDYFLDDSTFHSSEVPLFLVMFCVGATRYRAFERVRVPSRREFDSNVVWMLWCAAFTSVYCFLVWCLVEFTASGRTWDMPGVMVAQVFAMMVLNTFMQLVVVGMAMYLLVNLGVSWWTATAFMILFLMTAEWVFHSWAQVVPDMMFHFLKLKAPTMRNMVFDKLLPFAGCVVLMGMAARMAYDRRERLAD